MKQNITTGTRVTFDSEHGPQHGTVAEIKPHIGNGQSIAVIQVKGTQNGSPWQVPVNELHAVAA
ncbi:hypothetical protein [Noviherbaspirillum sp. Root189]|uniref:hypothetical protein n=1 Tax=Noviherbaspirillum sp. Root189 TaxID=1736487 RepID=UPI00070ADAFD|nr:hypothetical protein [Noviherbaspirillum sp. Root189]KRB73469.1 hypothetical protein ASE07_06345 [Noviherbaspirillum sp. Root189]